VDFVFPENATISPQCRDLITRILVANPAQRITIAEIFQHPWVQQASAGAA
jgi:serine/threonine-protein kinase SRK2